MVQPFPYESTISGQFNNFQTVRPFPDGHDNFLMVRPFPGGSVVSWRFDHFSCGSPIFGLLIPKAKSTPITSFSSWTAVKLPLQENRYIRLYIPLNPHKKVSSNSPPPLCLSLHIIEFIPFEGLDLISYRYYLDRRRLLPGRKSWGDSNDLVYEFDKNHIGAL